MRGGEEGEGVRVGEVGREGGLKSLPERTSSSMLPSWWGC